MQRLVVVFLALTACECGASGPVTQPSAPEIRAEETAAPEAEEVEESFFSNPSADPREPPTAQETTAFASASNGFGFQIYGKAREEVDGNFAISPASITLAFDMVFGGARGETSVEMARVMGLSEPAAEIHQRAGRVLARWNDPDRESYELRVVNRLFGEETFTFEQDFLTLTRTTYAAPFEGVDFRNAPDEQRTRINGWVAQQTDERITDLLPPPAITSSTRLVLVNAIYFLGTWSEQFDPDDTADADFTLADGSTVRVPMMRQTASFAFAQRDGVSIVRLPYEGGDLEMTLIIPDEPSGLSALEERLTAETFDRWVRSPQPGQVYLFLPRFEMRARVGLSTALKELGMRQAFDEMAADFTGMGRPPEPGLRLYISEAYHQVFVKVDEVGTEAAAATAVVMAVGGGPPPQPVEIRADHPFLFAIREPSSNTLLFIGRVVDPR